jgi:hypothetical protein
MLPSAPRGLSMPSRIPEPPAAIFVVEVTTAAAALIHSTLLRSA